MALLITGPPIMQQGRNTRGSESLQGQTVKFDQNLLISGKVVQGKITVLAIPCKSTIAIDALFIKSPFAAYLFFY